MTGSKKVCTYSEDEENLPKGVAPVACSEPAWNCREYCFWHARVAEKSVEEIATRWEGAPDRIDGIYLKKVHLRDRISLREKSYMLEISSNRI